VSTIYKRSILIAKIAKRPCVVVLFREAFFP
jgi:hypothetical protein